MRTTEQLHPHFKIHLILTDLANLETNLCNLKTKIV